MIEIFATLTAVIFMLYKKQEHLSVALLVSWIFEIIISLTFKATVWNASWLPAIYTIADIFVAVYAIYLWTEFQSQRARIVGFLSLIKIMFHFGISANLGSGNWIYYAFSINTIYIFQCLITAGLLNGVGGFFNRFRSRRSDCNEVIAKERRK